MPNRIIPGGSFSHISFAPKRWFYFDNKTGTWKNLVRAPNKSMILKIRHGMVVVSTQVQNMDLPGVYLAFPLFRKNGGN